MLNYYSKSSSSSSYETNIQQQQQSSISPRNLAAEFPSYYYPTAYQKQPNSTPLSPRQAEAVERQTPASAFTPRQADSPLASENHGRNAPAAKTKSGLPHQYLTFVAAPVGNKSFGNYPEFTGIGMKPAQPMDTSSSSPRQSNALNSLQNHRSDENGYGKW